MFKILEKSNLNKFITKMTIDAPLIAQKAKAGQFIILRVHEKGERIPLTIADYNKENGTITIIFQKVGKTTMLLDSLNTSDSILDIVGPLGNPTEFGTCTKVAIVGGGAACAIALPQAKALFNKNISVEIIAGFRNKDLIILENELRSVCNKLTILTDDGSNGNKGFVTQALKENIVSHANYDLAIAIGPLKMMQAVCEITKNYGIKTIVSMNPIMIDGTGMCGGCRIKIGNKMRFACIEGPDFDGHQVDFDEAINRLSLYKEKEQAAKTHKCNLGL